MSKTCSSCRFAEKKPHYMFCHRLPPAHKQLPSGKFNQFPRIFPTDWCGEYKPTKKGSKS